MKGNKEPLTVILGLFKKYTMVCKYCVIGMNVCVCVSGAVLINGHGTL